MQTVAIHAMVGLGFIMAHQADGATMVTLNVIASADSSIREDITGAVTDPPTQDRNYGSDVRFQVRTRTTSSSPRHEAVIMRFSLAGLKSILNSGGTIDDVDLMVTPSENDTQARFRGYGIVQAEDDDWTEGEVTYNNAPGLFPDGNDPSVEASDPGHDTYDMIPDGDTDSSNIESVPFGSQLLGSSYSANESVLYDEMSGFYEFVRDAAIAGDDDFTLIIHGSRGNAPSPNFYSKDALTALNDGNGFLVGDSIPASFYPQLVVSATVPEPSALAIGGLGIVCLVAARGRRRR